MRVRNFRRLVAIASIGASLTASQAPAAPLMAIDKEAALIGPHASRLPDGQIEVTLPDGLTLMTHGPDARPNHGFSFSQATPRDPVCSTDSYQHILYGSYLLGSNRFDAVKDNLIAIVKRMNGVLNHESMESGNMTADFKVLCNEAGKIQVDQFLSPRTDYETIVSSARLAGFDETQNYTIFFDSNGGGYCGLANISRDSRLIAGNGNNNGENYAVTYAPCWYGRTPMHENGHNMGAVQVEAPYSTGTGAHCYDQYDVMCYTPDGGDRNQTHEEFHCTDRIHYDCRHDTYFDSRPEGGEWLESHWNIGSALNRFISFGEYVAPPPPPLQDIQVGFRWSCVHPKCAFSPAVYDPNQGTSELNDIWEFGDGTTSNVVEPVHTYAASGVYTVTLTVTNDRGQSNSRTRSVTVYAEDQDPASPTLANNDHVALSRGSSGTWHYYKIQVPTGADYLISNSSDGYCSIDCNLNTFCPAICLPAAESSRIYVKFGSKPDDDSYECAANASCFIGAPAEGFWYLGIKNLQDGEAPLSIGAYYDQRP